ncbi:MAG: phosphodiesterase YaeI [Bryobacterales bacterium]|nr:phosphodiesterase YaeI [Bryobacterales bacterium]
MHLSRRTLLRSAGAIVGGGLALGGYAFGVEPHWLELTQHTIPTRWLPKGARLRVLHLSDLHASSAVPFDWIEAAFQLGLAQKPDLICLTGDYVTTNTECDRKKYRTLLSTLPPAAPTFASVGNHDGGRWTENRRSFQSSAPIREMLSSAGIDVLHNQHKEQTIAGQKLLVVGLADFWTKEFDSRAAFDGLAKQADRLRIVLSHNPDTKAVLQYYSWELLLSGHTHGGQVVVPVLGPPILPIIDTDYFEGLYDWQGRRVYITRGIGGIFGAVRFNCRPEVTILDLVPGESPVELTESQPRARS